MERSSLSRREGGEAFEVGHEAAVVPGSAALLQQQAQLRCFSLRSRLQYPRSPCSKAAFRG